MFNRIPRVCVTFRRFLEVISILFLISAAFAQNGPTITVNCGNGQSLNHALSQLDKQKPATVVVEGTCTEFVKIDGFEALTLKGQSGAAIQQPASNPQSYSYVLSITGSLGITVFGLNVKSITAIYTRFLQGNR